MIAIEQLSTELASDSGMVRAVDALSLTIESGQLLPWSVNRAAASP